MPDVNAFEHDGEAVLADLRRGTFDYVEVASRVTEARFFRYLLDQGNLEKLAKTYPTPRKKEEVPLWLYLASQLTLRLHGQHAYQTFPYILHCGGLRDALGPGQVQVTEEEGGGEERRLRCEGYNQKNDYERKTPCDPDFLRKLARDTQPSALVAWFNHHVARYQQDQGAFDDEGVFLVDGSYLFVPDNPNYGTRPVNPDPVECGGHWRPAHEGEAGVLLAGPVRRPLRRLQPQLEVQPRPRAASSIPEA